MGDDWKAFCERWSKNWKAFCERAEETSHKTKSSLDVLEDEFMMNKLSEYKNPKYKLGDTVCAICSDYKESIIIGKVESIILENPSKCTTEPIYILSGCKQYYLESELHYYKR